MHLFFFFFCCFLAFLMIFRNSKPLNTPKISNHFEFRQKWKQPLYTIPHIEIPYLFEWVTISDPERFPNNHLGSVHVRTSIQAKNPEMNRKKNKIYRLPNLWLSLRTSLSTHFIDGTTVRLSQIDLYTLNTRRADFISKSVRLDFKSLLI